MNCSSSMLEVYPCTCGGDNSNRLNRMRETRSKGEDKKREGRSKNSSSHGKLRPCGSCPPTGRYEKPSKQRAAPKGDCICCECPGIPIKSSASSDPDPCSKSSKTSSKTSKTSSKIDVLSSGPFRCPYYDQPAQALTCRLKQVRCFGEMVFDETRFIRFCKRLHIVLGTCVYSWLMAFFCLLESISYRYYFEEVRFYFQQNEFIENLLDYCCIIEGKLIEWMTCPCECGDIWHYFKLLVLMPFLLSNSIISIKLSFVLKIKLFIFGERCICGDLNPKEKIPLGIRRCCCGATTGILKGGSHDQLVDLTNKKVVLNLDSQQTTDAEEMLQNHTALEGGQSPASASTSKPGSASKLQSDGGALSKQPSMSSKAESMKISASLGSSSSGARRSNESKRSSEARRLSEQKLINEAKLLSERLSETKRLSKTSSNDSKRPSA